MRMPLRSVDGRDGALRERDVRVFEWAQAVLARGGVLRPEDVPD